MFRLVDMYTSCHSVTRKSVIISPLTKSDAQGRMQDLGEGGGGGAGVPHR